MVARRLERAARVLAVAVVATGVLVLLGWAFGIPRLTSLHPTFVSMKPNTAVCLVLAGVALWLRGCDRAARGATVCAGVVVATATMTLVRYAVGVDLGIDEALCSDVANPVGTSAPGRMASTTALALLLLGAGLVVLDAGPRDRHPAAWCALVVAAAMLLPLAGYLYGVAGPAGLAAHTQIAAHTSAALLALAVGILCARPTRGPMATIASATMTGEHARRLVPVVVALPLGLGWLSLLGQRAGHFETELGVALVAVAAVVALVGLAWYGASVLLRAERQREQALCALSERELNLAITLDSIGDAVIATDIAGDVVRMNPVAEHLTGWPAALALSRPLTEVFNIVNEETRAAVENPVTRALREGVAVGLANHTVLKARDGTERPIADSAAPIRDHAGVVRGGVLVFRDQTAERQAEADRERVHALELDNARVREADRLKGVFLAHMSHELRTPLNTVIGFAELVHDGEVGPILARQREFLGHVLASGKQLLRLIDDVLDLAKVEAGELSFHPERVDVARVVEDVVSMLRTEAAEKGIAVEVAVAPGIGEVELDVARLHQVLDNYLSNAIKFTPGVGRVIVSVAAEGPMSFRISVEDTGPGIAPEALPRLFHEFQRVHDGATRRVSGTGLGLALTRRLVEAQGGSVGVRSVVGVGSCFHAVLPCRAPLEGSARE